MTHDPFAKARAIRRGELDDRLPMYDEITGWIQRVPETWLPGILAQTIASCVVAKVFQEGSLVPFVQRCETNAKDPTSVLRKGPTMTDDDLIAMEALAAKAREPPWGTGATDVE